MKFSVKSLISDSEKISGKKEFLSLIPRGIGLVRSQICRFESRQFYIENDPDTNKKIENGQWKELAQDIANVRTADVPSYFDLKNRGVEMIRCRPLVLPLTDYMRFELAAYQFNASVYEDIYLYNHENLKHLSDDLFSFDFMIFDARFALIFDINSSGHLEGGYLIEDQEKIMTLLAIFFFAKAHSFELFHAMRNSTKLVPLIL